MSAALEFRAWPKTPRLNRDIVVTEKIDGTNGAIIIDGPHPFGWHVDGAPEGTSLVFTGEDIAGTPDHEWIVGAQSRNRLVGFTKAADNHGFGKWVADRAEALVHILGAGHHFGEFWGQGIARNYGLDHKRFSLFNVARGQQLIELAGKDGWVAPGLDTVPVLYQGPFGEDHIRAAVNELHHRGSFVAAEGWQGKAEGVCVFHTASRQVYKVLLHNDELPKSLAEAA